MRFANTSRLIWSLLATACGSTDSEPQPEPTELGEPIVMFLQARASPSEAEPLGPLAIRFSQSSRQELAAVDALAVLTGWDARYTADRAPRPLDDVVSDYVRLCGAALKAQ